MIYGSQPTQLLSDRMYSPRESFPLVFAICSDDRLFGASGRTRMRRLLGPEHEKSDRDIPGLRGFPVWRYILRGNVVEPAPRGTDVTGLPTVYLLGPTAKKFISIHASRETTGPQAAVIMAHIAGRLGVTP